MIISLSDLSWQLTWHDSVDGTCHKNPAKIPGNAIGESKPVWVMILVLAERLLSRPLWQKWTMTAENEFKNSTLIKVAKG